MQPWYRRSLVPSLAKRQDAKQRAKLVSRGQLCPRCGSRNVRNVGRRGRHWFWFGIFALLKGREAQCMDCGVQWKR